VLGKDLPRSGIPPGGATTRGRTPTVAADPYPATTPGTNSVPILPASYEGRVHANRHPG